MGASVSDKWLWITIISAVSIVAIPLIVVWAILSISPELRIVATVAIVVLWGVVSGYKDWVISKRQESEKLPTPA